MNLIKIKKVGTGHQIKQNKKKILRTFKEGTCITNTKYTKGGMDR